MGRLQSVVLALLLLAGGAAAWPAKDDQSAEAKLWKLMKARGAKKVCWGSRALENASRRCVRNSA